MSYQMEPRLEAVLVRLCERMGSLNTMQAVKLPYIVDIVAKHALSRSITGGTHQTWKLGVVTKEVYRFAKYPEPDSVLEIVEEEYSESASVRCRGDARMQLSDEEIEVIDFVVDQYGSISSSSLGELTKALNTELSSDAWGSNGSAKVDEEAYLRLDDAWQNFARKLPFLNLDAQELWSEPIQDDPVAHFKRRLAPNST